MKFWDCTDATRWFLFSPGFPSSSFLKETDPKSILDFGLSSGATFTALPVFDPLSGSIAPNQFPFAFKWKKEDYNWKRLCQTNNVNVTHFMKYGSSMIWFFPLVFPSFYVMIILHYAATLHTYFPELKRYAHRISLFNTLWGLHNEIHFTSITETLFVFSILRAEVIFRRIFYLEYKYLLMLICSALNSVELVRRFVSCFKRNFRSFLNQRLYYLFSSWILFSLISCPIKIFASRESCDNNFLSFFPRFKLTYLRDIESTFPSAQPLVSSSLLNKC